MTALLLIDFQRGMCDDDGPAGSTGLAEQVRERGVLEAAARALEVARREGWDITHVRLEFNEAYSNRTNRTERFDGHERAKRFLAGSRECEFRPEVEPREGETVVGKGSVGPFASTSILASYLARGIDDLVIAGVATHLSVESAAREAADRGLRVRVLGDACATPAPALHEHAVSATIPGFAEVVNSTDLG